jgi:DNA-binding MarR family transcriptional regulator
MTDAETSTADALAQLSFLVLRTIEQTSAEHGLSPAQARMLGILRDREPLMTELGTRLGLDKSSVTGLVDRAERRGLVERFRSTADGRAVHVRLTPEGRERTALAAAAFEAEIARLVSVVSDDEAAQLTRIAGRLVQPPG